ncbi:LysR family transcriptional regulator [Terriglobus albidus]|uniref:LysR family transcriptional regulator n=1 Tax=Terriglobus albidus TaxID=1592106 RepID=A0A5B9ECQ8_9BACT|nr:LysR family transcriptional regulator [Terriglobus albidus]QEE28935.1 LysR family transcriptional regulator [Terriglobus albidus]
MIRMMNLAGFDLNLLVVLDALLTEAHVGRAARKAGLSQPATSHALNRLRHLLSDPLLVRIGSRMQLTPRAAQLRDSLPDLLHQLQNTLNARPFSPESSDRTFSIQMQDHVAHLVLPPLVERLNAEAPGITLSLVAWQSPVMLAPERYQTLDFLISCADIDLPGFYRRSLFTDTEVVVFRAGRSLPRHLSRLDSFLTAKHVAVVGYGASEDPVDVWLRQEGQTRRIALRVPNYLQALQAVSQTDLVAVVPKRFVTIWMSPLSLSMTPPPINPGKYREQLFSALRTEQDPASIWMKNLIVRVTRDI